MKILEGRNPLYHSADRIADLARRKISRSFLIKERKLKGEKTADFKTEGSLKILN